MEMIAVVLAAVATVAVVVWFVLPTKHPEDAAGHEPTGRSVSGALHGDTNDRPAGPGAEADGVAGRGQPAPGPSADSLDVVDTPQERRYRGVDDA